MNRTGKRRRNLLAVNWRSEAHKHRRPLRLHRGGARRQTAASGAQAHRARTGGLAPRQGLNACPQAQRLTSAV